MYKLAICIPTYNRKSELFRLLNDACKQIQDSFDSEVQICISDNASIDHTKEMVYQVQKMYSKVSITYHCNATNIGPCRNFLSCVEMSDAEYCWLFGSDDTIAESGIAKALDNIRNQNAELIVGRRSVYDNTISKRLFTDSWIKQKKDYCIDFSSEEEKIALYNQISTTTAMFGFMSVLIFKRDIWTRINFYDEFIGLGYMHTCILMRYLENFGGKVVYMRDIITFSRVGDDSFYQSLGQRVYMDIWGYYNISKLIRKDATRKEFCKIICRHFNNVFLNAMALSGFEMTSEAAHIFREIGFSERQCSYIVEQRKTIIYIRLSISLFMMLVHEPDRFYFTSKIVLQRRKLKKHGQ